MHINRQGSKSQRQAKHTVGEDACRRHAHPAGRLSNAARSSGRCCGYQARSRKSSRKPGRRNFTEQALALIEIGDPGTVDTQNMIARLDIREHLPHLLAPGLQTLRVTDEAAHFAHAGVDNRSTGNKLRL